MRNMKFVALIALLAMTVAACGGSSGETTTTEAAVDPTTTAGMADEEMGETVADVVVANDDFSTLLAAVEAAGLTGALADPDATLTVFAPTNAAFDAALADLGITADELLADTETLTAILTYHVLGDVVTSSDIVAAGTEEIPVETLSGAQLIVVLTDDGNVTFQDQSATVTTADVDASNGVIHIIDAVLLPPLDA
jgi:transforming growth factor-beta-induced protein